MKLQSCWWANNPLWIELYVIWEVYFFLWHYWVVFFSSSKKFWLLFGQKLKERSNNTQLKCCFRFSLAFLLYLLLYSKESNYCLVVFKTRRPAHLHSQYVVFFVIVLETLQILGYITEKQVRLTCKLRDQNLLFSPSTVSIKKAENIL